MSNRLYFVFILSHILSTSDAQNLAIEWQKNFGGSSQDVANFINVCSDGGFVVAGSTVSNNGDVSGNHGNNDYWVLKLDSAGNLLWQNALGGSLNDRASRIAETSDGGFIVAGSTSSNDGDVSGNHGSDDCWIVKLNSSGNLLWQKTYGGSNSDHANAIQETSDGGFIVAGWTSSNDGDVTSTNGNNDYWIFKLDNSGVLLWEKTYGGSYIDEGRSVQETSDGGFIVAGLTLSDDGDVTGTNGNGDCWVLKLDGSGNLQWKKALGGALYEEANSIRETNDGGFVLTGWTISMDGDVSGNPGYIDCWVVKLNSAGDLQWQHPLGGVSEDIGTSIHAASDGSILVAGYTYSNDGDVSGNHGLYDGWVLKLDSLGVVIGQRALGGTSSDQAICVQEANDGELVVAGWSLSDDGDVGGNYGASDMWIVRLSNNYATLNGSVFTDLNSNSIQDGSELGSAGHMIVDQNNGKLYFADASGRFAVQVSDTGASTIAPDLYPYYSAQPGTHSANFSTLQQQIDSLNDFALQPLGAVNDLQIALTPVGFFRPGFAAHYIIDFKNIGTNSISPELVFFPDPLLSFDNSSTSPTALYADSVKWQLPTLLPLGSGQITVHLTVDVNAVIGSTLSSSTRIDPVTGDVNINDNWAAWDVPVRGSFDPNDILVDRSSIQLSELNPTATDLSYIIRFQNTGTDTAFTVRVENDVPENADFSSFQFVSSSHPVQIKYLQYANRFEYTFNNILLADSNTNEAASHGFIRYTMKPKNTLVAGDSVLNTAGIYFDFNLPVLTNTAFSEISEPGLNLSIRAMLEGPFDQNTGMMHDSLRVAGHPLYDGGYLNNGIFEPSSSALTHLQDQSLISVTGANAIVDWVLIELRSPDSLSAVVESRLLPLQRDGDVIELNGTSEFRFASPDGMYHVAVRHRNHLGAITDDPFYLSDALTALDFSDMALKVWGTDALKDLNGTMVLWAGNVERDGILKYIGVNNDRDPILVKIGGNISTATWSGYAVEDLNMDGTVKYTGAANDRDPILVNIGGSVPTATRLEQLP